MPIDPYAALHALLRAEAVRNAPSPEAPGSPAPSQKADGEDHEKDHRPERDGR